MKREAKKYSAEVRKRAVRMVVEHAAEYPSRWAAGCSVAAKIGCNTATLHEWVKRRKVDQGTRVGVTTADAWSGPEGVTRGRTTRTTVGDKAARCPLDHVNRRRKPA